MICIRYDTASNKMPSQDIYVNPSELGLNELPEDQFDERVQEDILHKLTAFVKTAKRGDTISLQKAGEKYRNVWTFMWDGEKALKLDSIIDEYGVVPQSLKVTDTEFSPDWWVDTIEHNSIFWLSDEIKSRMVFKREGEQIFADFLIGETTWRCYVDYPEIVKPSENLETLANHKNAYFQMSEAECTVSSSPENPHVFYLHFTPDYEMDEEDY